MDWFPFSPCAERFVEAGYRDPISLENQISCMAAVAGMRGVALDYPAQFTDDQAAHVGGLCESYGLEIATLEIGLYAHRKQFVDRLCPQEGRPLAGAHPQTRVKKTGCRPGLVEALLDIRQR